MVSSRYIADFLDSNIAMEESGAPGELVTKKHPCGQSSENIYLNQPF